MASSHILLTVVHWAKRVVAKLLGEERRKEQMEQKKNELVGDD